MAGLILAGRLMLAEVAEEVAWRCEETAHGMPDGVPATIVEHAAQAAQAVEAWLSGRTRGGAV